MVRKNIAKVIACILLIGIALLLLGIALMSVASAETAEQQPIVETKTMVWQTIRFNDGAKITVMFEYPDPMRLGDEISFYCEYKNCEEDDFKYTWQYSGDFVYWTSFGNHPRMDTTYCDMLAGKYIRLEVERIEND